MRISDWSSDVCSSDLSTLIDIISGITPIGEGAIYLGEHEARGQGSETRAYQGLARTFQHPQVAKELTLRENVLIGASVDELKGLPRVFGSALVSTGVASRRSG